MSKRRTLLAAALLAASVSMPAVAGQATLSDEELGNVSAQGIQVVDNPTDISNQQNNNDSVQANGSSQSGASGMQVTNMVNSAANTQTNTASIDNSTNIDTVQSNSQYAENHEYSFQNITNSADVSNQNNNNASVQMNDSSQVGVTAGIVSNVSGSAINIGQNIASITNSMAIGLSQSNSQYASNEGYDEQYITNMGTNSTQNNNNTSVQLNSQSQSSSSTFVMSNTAGSAENIGQNFVFVDGLVSSSIEQYNYQEAYNNKVPYQEIYNDGQTSMQNNNNGSVQVNDSAQSNSSSIAMSNTANSAKNIGQSIIDATNMNGLNIISQSNEQYAYNGGIGSTTLSHVVINGEVSIQNNNNQSVQLNSDAQVSSSGVLISNTANSAENIGQNVADITGTVAVNIISSSNYQQAANYTRWDVDQTVGSGSSDLQRNNNNSVQLNDNSQNSASGLSITNTAASASNVGQNIANTGEFIGFNVVSQSNEQYAYNGAGWSNWSFQNVTNDDGVFTLTTAQDNNNASVQMNDEATSQNNINAINLANISHSASNIAQNMANVANAAFGNIVIQSNYQEAYNESYVAQGIGNYGVVNVNVDQDNNNASVQSQDGQNNVNVLSMANISSSASNIAQNVASLSALAQIGIIGQSNMQEAYNATSASQDISNASFVLEVNAFQDNNNSSVQANSSQNNANALSFANISSSAANIGQNILDISDIAGLDLAQQINTQSAYNESGSYQAVTNNGTFLASLSLVQDNNNGSVQLNSSQNNAQGLSFINSSNSAANNGMNIANIQNPIGLTAAMQINDQYAENYSYAEQTVSNDISVAQDNNNGSVQLNNSQNNISSMAVLNTSLAAVNNGINLANISGSTPFGTVVSQSNYQTAINDSDAEQTIYNNIVIAGQNNNNGSVQLNNSQTGASSLVLANIVNSAANTGFNMAAISGASGWTLNQVSVQRAINY